MLSEFGIRLPDKINRQLRNHMKQYNIAHDVNMIRMGDFDLFTIGHDGLPHVRLANIGGKWTYSIIDPHRLDDNGDVLVKVEE